jgi:hypothetical protein
MAEQLAVAVFLMVAALVYFWMASRPAPGVSVGLFWAMGAGCVITAAALAIHMLHLGAGDLMFLVLMVAGFLITLVSVIWSFFKKDADADLQHIVGPH